MKYGRLLMNILITITTQIHAPKEKHL